MVTPPDDLPLDPPDHGPSGPDDDLPDHGPSSLPDLPDDGDPDSTERGERPTDAPPRDEPDGAEDAEDRDSGPAGENAGGESGEEPDVAAGPAADPAPEKDEPAPEKKRKPKAKGGKSGGKKKGGKKGRKKADEKAAKPPAPKPASGVRWWIDTIFEVMFLLGLVIAAELIWEGRIGTFRVHPHPYWVLVLPMAAARGVRAALLAAICATLLYLVGALREISAGSIHEILTLEVMLEPLLFFTVGFLVGDFRDVNAERIKRLRRKLGKSTDEHDDVRLQRDVLSEANRILERRLVDQSMHFGNLIEAAGRAELASRREVFEIALDLVEEHCGASSSVLLAGDDGNLHLICERGWPEGKATDRLNAARDSEVVWRAIEEGREVNAFSLDEEPPEDGPMVAIPLRSGAGLIEAVLCLDEIPTSLLNTSTIRTFQAIGEWASATLGRLDREPSEQAMPVDPTRLEPPKEWLGTPEDLAVRLRLEYERTTRYGTPLSVLTIQFTELDESKLPDLRRVDDFVRRHLTARLRCSDAVCRFPHPGCYLVLLPGTPIEGGEVVRGRLSSRLREGATPFGQVRIQVTGPDPDAPDPESLLQRLVDRFRENGSLKIARKSTLLLPKEARVGSLEECVQALAGEIGLAMRNEVPFQVLGVLGTNEDASEAGLLALHVQQVADRIFRKIDAVYSVGPNHLAILLPSTKADQAEKLGDRLRDALREIEIEPAYGEVNCTVMSFGAQLPYYGAFLEALSVVRPLKHVAEAGGGE